MRREAQGDVDGAELPASGRILPNLRARYFRLSDPVLLLIALVSVPIAIIEFLGDDLRESDRTLVSAASTAVFAAFAIDLVIKLAMTAPRNWAQLLRREWQNVTIVVIGAALATYAVTFPARNELGAGIGAMLRVGVRLARTLVVAHEVRRELVRVLSRHPLGFVVALVGTTWGLSTAMILVFELDASAADGFNSIGNAAWWAIVTMATVGYGDLAPETLGGRITAVFTMLVGIGSFSIVTGEFADFFRRSRRGEQET